LGIQAWWGAIVIRKFVYDKKKIITYKCTKKIKILKRFMKTIVLVND